MGIMVLDIGGTVTKAGIFENGELFDVREFSTQAGRGGPYVMERVKEIIGEYRIGHSLERIGVSTAGQVDPKRGNIIYANKNIPDYTGMPVVDLLQEAFQVPVSVENDVNAAAIGEAVFGAGRGQRDFVCLTLGTGVGGAIFTEGKLYRGATGSAGEFGGIVTHPEARDLSAGVLSGCYEQYASVTALVARAMLLDKTLTDGRAIFARLEEPAVRTIVDAWIEEIWYGLAGIIHILNPSCVIMGGGVMEQPYVIKKILKRRTEQIIPGFLNVQIKNAALGNRAGMMGAAVLHDVQEYEGR